MNICILEPLAINEELLTQLKENFPSEKHTFSFFDNKPKNDEEILERAKDADIIMLVNLPLSGEVIGKLPNLKMISIAFTGYDHVDLEECNKRDIVVTNTAGYSTYSVAELTFGLIFSLLRKINQGDIATKQSEDRTGLLGSEIYGKTIGIVGTGAIGTQVATVAKAFGCKLLGYNRTEKNTCNNLGMKYVDLPTLFSQSDIVSVHLPLNAESKDLIGKNEFELMKKTALLINTARGGVVNEKDLVAALNSNELAGAGIDVFEIEPPLPSDYVLLEAKNTVLTPHVAFATREALDRRAEIAFDNIQEWLDQGKVTNQVN